MCELNSVIYDCIIIQQYKSINLYTSVRLVGLHTPALSLAWLVFRRISQWEFRRTQSVCIKKGIVVILPWVRLYAFIFIPASSLERVCLYLPHNIFTFAIIFTVTWITRFSILSYLPTYLCLLHKFILEITRCLFNVGRSDLNSVEKPTLHQVSTRWACVFPRQSSVVTLSIETKNPDACAPRNWTKVAKVS